MIPFNPQGHLQGSSCQIIGLRIFQSPHVPANRGTDSADDDCVSQCSPPYNFLLD